ncbi:MAG: diacylglycerol kinase family protein [Emticicia sp.]|nr:diacylglycerol kinase family protein [Emticicia sp.]
MNKQAVWFIVNPISGGKKKHQEIINLIDNQLDKNIYIPKVYYTEYAGHATEIAAEAVKNNIPMVVAIGGDGTVNEVGKALINTKTALGIIPTGSGNGLARELQIPLKPAKAIESLNTPVSKQIDVCYVNDIPFFCTAGVGFDAHCAEIFSKKSGRGLWTYIKVAFAEFWKSEPLKCVFAGNDYEVFSITFGNASQFGNDAYITPTAVIDDGMIDCTIISPPSAFQALSMISQLFNGNIHSSELSENYRGTKFKLQNEQNFLIHYDGEPLQLPANELIISISEKSLRVII